MAENEFIFIDIQITYITILTGINIMVTILHLKTAKSFNRNIFLYSENCFLGI